MVQSPTPWEDDETAKHQHQRKQRQQPELLSLPHEIPKFCNE
jgi:hypothetical protein